MQFCNNQHTIYVYRHSFGKAQVLALCNRSAWQCKIFHIDLVGCGHPPDLHKSVQQSSVRICINYKLLVLSVTCVLSSSGRTFQLGEGALDDSQLKSSILSQLLTSLKQASCKAKSRKTSRSATVKSLTLHCYTTLKVQRLLFHSLCRNGYKAI